METGRLETFSDGVIAIAITLLVLELPIPDVDEDGFWRAFLHLWPSLIAYTISFLTIGVMWINHHTIFVHVARTNRIFMLLNTLLLMSIAFVPYPTKVMAAFLEEGKSARDAVILYGIALTCCAICFNVLWNYASRWGHLLREDADPVEVAGITRSYLPGVPLYLSTVVVAIINPLAAFILHAVIVVFYALSATFWAPGWAKSEL
ncbi:MAG TPA: TMEM175 family protein [Gaiellaceae bacterium]|nr:TMEM175 family protein [Gaiellaceae bacterium]